VCCVFVFYKILKGRAAQGPTFRLHGKRKRITLRHNLRLWKATVYHFDVNCGGAMFHMIDTGALAYRWLERSYLA
jgi:hypothetical protein